MISENKKKIIVNSSQFNYQYRNRLHLPYSIATLVTYIKSKNDLNQNFGFEKTFVFRNKIDDYVKQCEKSDILLCSCYVWNWEITTYLASNVKRINPSCLIIFGGPHVPNSTDGFFIKYPFIDMIVHGEGEIVLENILREYLTTKDYSKILGLETKDFKNPPQQRIDDFSSIPSPYLTDEIWDLVDRSAPVQWIAAWETLRGCPYSCTFCDWGSATATKMRKFSDDKVMKEIEWFANNKIPYVDCCDANFGIYQERDLRISNKLKEVKAKTGFPETFHPTFAKFSSEKIIPIAKELQNAGLLRAVTLAVQSLDKRTLGIIKRENMKFDNFSELTESFRKSGIPTYTEIIMGLPGETLESFKLGLETIVSDTKIGSIYIYHCGLFPNAPMADKTYMETYKIKSIRSPIYLQHSDINNRGIEEYEDLVIGSFSYTIDDLKKMYLYSWLIQTFQSLGILEQIANYYKIAHGLDYISFYDVFLDYCKTQNSIFSEELKKVEAHAENGYSGKGWNHYDPKLGNIYWPIEEASWARLSWDDQMLTKNIELFLNFLENVRKYNTDKNILQDLIRWNVFLLTTRTHNNETKSEFFEFDWKSFFTQKSILRHNTVRYEYRNPVTEKDPIMWTWNAIFFGRPSRRYKFDPEFLIEAKI